MSIQEKSIVKKRYEQYIYWSSISVDAIRVNNSSSVYVLGYIKSGTNWLCNMISSTLDLPVLEPWNLHWTATKPCVFHMHRFIPLNSIRRRTVYLMRDGRDTLISLYFQLARFSDNQSQMKNEFETQYDKNLTAENIIENLPDFIKYMSNCNIATMDYCIHIENWKKHEDKYITLRYEDMLNDAEKSLSYAISKLTKLPVDSDKIKQAVEANSFQNVTNRKPGEADATSFVRKGISGDWRNYFTAEAAHIYDKYAGKTLLMTGYETDPNWADKITS